MLSSARSGFQVSCSDSSPYPLQTRSVGTIVASTTCRLRTTAELCSTWRYSLLLLLYHVSYPTKSKIREMWGFSLLPAVATQQHDASISPSCYTTTVTKPRSDAVSPTSFSMHVGMALVPCVTFRVCCALSLCSICGLEISHHGHFTYIIFLHWNNV